MEDRYDYTVYTSDLNDRFGRIKDDSYLFDMGKDQFDDNKYFALMQDEKPVSIAESKNDDNAYTDEELNNAVNGIYEEYIKPQQEKKR